MSTGQLGWALLGLWPHPPLEGHLRPRRGSGPAGAHACFISGQEHPGPRGCRAHSSTHPVTDLAPNGLTGGRPFHAPRPS